MKITETRYMLATELRSLCIKHDWYTLGTNEEYGNLFDRLYDEYGCPVHLTAEKLYEIALDIWEHSEIKNHSIDAVMYELAKKCTTVFDVYEEE